MRPHRGRPEVALVTAEGSRNVRLWLCRPPIMNNAKCAVGTRIRQRSAVRNESARHTGVWSALEAAPPRTGVPEAQLARRCTTNRSRKTTANRRRPPRLLPTWVRARQLQWPRRSANAASLDGRPRRRRRDSRSSRLILPFTFRLTIRLMSRLTLSPSGERRAYASRHKRRIVID